MSKIKMRCITCGKWFQSANAKEVTCPECTQKARKEKMASKNPSASTATPTRSTGPGGQGTRTTPPPPKPKPKAPSGPGHWLDTLSDVKVGEPEQPSTRPKLPSTPPPHEREREHEQRGGPERPGYRGPGGYQEDRGPGSRGPGSYRDREPGYRGPGTYSSGLGISGTIGQRPRQPMEPGIPRGPRPGPGGPGEGRPDRRPGGKKGGKPKAAGPKAPPQPKPKREKIPPPLPFVPTSEQIAQVEARYTELAVPAEYDGIRTQISKELGIPKKAVKKIIKDLRDREHIPSWWELQTYKGPSEELEKIREAYVPYLPLPPIGIHKKIAEDLSLQPGTVYQAIKAIRQEMDLPQFNDPTLHGLEVGLNGRLVQKGEKEPVSEGEGTEPVAAAETAETTTQDEVTTTESPATTNTIVETTADAVVTATSEGEQTTEK